MEDMDMEDVRFVPVRDPEKDYSKSPPLHDSPKQKPQGAWIAIFSPKKQQPEIPNMLWRLGSNSVEFCGILSPIWWQGAHISHC